MSDEQQETSTSAAPSPLNMPGAEKYTPPAQQTMHPSKPQAPKSDDGPSDPELQRDENLSAEDREELERLRNFRKQTRDWEKIAKRDRDDAERYRAIAEAFGTTGNGEDSKEFDAKAEIQKLRAEREAERQERFREQVARETGVPPMQIQGNNLESMQASAQRTLEWVKQFVGQQGNVPGNGAPLAAPASSVNSQTPPHENGVKQIQSHDELARMSHHEVMEAYRQGRLQALGAGAPRPR